MFTRSVERNVRARKNRMRGFAKLFAPLSTSNVGAAVLWLYLTTMTAGAVGQVATVIWVHVHTGDPIPGNALVGGSDYDQHLGTVPHQTLYVCRVALRGGLHPGKLLNNNCNVSWGGGGTEYHDFEVATITGGPGHWAGFDPAHTREMLVGGRESTGSPLYVCHANYIHRESGPLGVFPSDHDSGVHPGKLVNGKCDVEWGSKELALTQYVAVFYLTPPPPPTHPAPPPPQPTPGPCGVPGRPLCTAACPPQQIFCGTLAQPDNYPGQSIQCGTGLKGACVPFVCTDQGYTRPYPICR
jgi:hypothetical protein